MGHYMASSVSDIDGSLSFVDVRERHTQVIPDVMADGKIRTKGGTMRRTGPNGDRSEKIRYRPIETMVSHE